MQGRRAGRAGDSAGRAGGQEAGGGGKRQVGQACPGRGRAGGRAKGRAGGRAGRAGRGQDKEGVVSLYFIGCYSLSYCMSSPLSFWELNLENQRHVYEGLFGVSEYS